MSKLKPEIILGNVYEDYRGKLSYNNEFDYSQIKRIYFIENAPNTIRAWQGHKIEKRWFCAINGSFRIKVVEINDWENLKTNYKTLIEFILSDQKLSYLFVPENCFTSIEALDIDSKLMVFSDYEFGSVNDDYKLESDFFI